MLTELSALTPVAHERKRESMLGSSKIHSETISYEFSDLPVLSVHKRLAEPNSPEKGTSLYLLCGELINETI
jgi:hypothetical protein